jgi:VWFA-related protein
MTSGNFRPRPRRAAPGVRLACIALLSAAALALPAAADPAPPGSAAAAAATSAGTAESGETFYESVDVDVVNVEVVATGRSGHPVTNLTQDDFELYEDGRPVAITNFFRSAEEPARPDGATPGRAASVAAAQAVPKSPDQVLNFAVFVDNQNLTPSARRPALAALRDFFRTHVGTGDHVILASYDEGIKVSQPSASDPAALAAAMNKMMMAVTHGGLADDNARRLQRAQVALEENGGRDAAIELGELNEERQLSGEIDVQRGRRGLTALASFITSLAGLPGRKALVVVTGAFAEQADPLLARLAEHANANRVTVYVLGAVETTAAGQLVGERSIGNGSLAAADALTGGLHSVADRTGGLTAVKLDDPLSFLEQIRADVSTYYSLGFTPEHKRDGKVHKLAVKAKGHQDVALRYRETYEDRSGDQRTASATLSTLLLGMGENPLGVEISFEPLKPSSVKGLAALPVVVHVPLNKIVLIPQERFHEGKLTLFVGSRDADGRMSNLKRLSAPVHVANDKLMTALGQAVGYRVEIPVRTGEGTVAVGVRDEIGHVDSTVSVPLAPAQTARAAAPPAHRPGR